MREIKFRGYNGLEWLYTEMIRYVSEDDFWQMMNHETDEWDCVSFIGQYTGLNDKNGTEIYEGDRVIDEENFLWEVVFEDGCFFIENIDMPAEKIPLYTLAGLYSYRLEHFEKIGNIYDNPELLEVE